MKRILVLASVGLLGGPAGAVLPDDIAIGTHVEVEGTLSRPGEVMATDVELKRGGAKNEIEGPIDSVDTAGRSLVIGGVRVALEPSAEILGDHDVAIDFAAVAPGMKAEAQGRFENGTLRAGVLNTDDLEPDDARELEVEGVVTKVDAAAGTFEVMGLRILVTPRTKVVAH
jgi:hypothetical protein